VQTEILEDSELDFEEGHREKIEYLENAMIKATRNSDYDTFMAMWNEMKELCESGGAGGIHYFSQFYSNDPRIKELKQIKDGPKYHSVLDMLSEEGPSESKDIYMLVENADYKMLRSLVSKKAIKRIPDSAIYYIDGQDISKVVERIRSQQMREKRIAEEYTGKIPELTFPSEEEFHGMMYRALENIQSQAETRKKSEKTLTWKRKGLFSLFSRK